MRRNALLFFLLAYALAWSCWSAARALGATSAAPIAGAVVLLGVFAPGLVALALTRFEAGPQAMLALLRRIGHWRVGARWYLFAVLYMPAVKLTAALIHRVGTGAWPAFGREAWYVMAGAILVSTWVQAGEEIGWRGYALPRLSERFGVGASSVIVGVLWAGWHLPLFLLPFGDTYGQSFPLYLTQATALSIVFGWLYWRTGGSLLLVMLLHAAVNNTKDIVPSVLVGALDPFTLNASTVGWITVTVLWVAAVYFLFAMRNARLSPETVSE
jgi:hypothetical protein